MQDTQQKGIAKILSTVLSPEGGFAGNSDLAPDVAYSLARNFLASHASLKMPSSKAEFIERYKQNKSLAAVVNEIAGIEREVGALRKPRDQLQDLLNKLFLNKVVDLSDGNIRIRFNASDDQVKALKLSQLSSGEKQALFILIHALRAERNSLIIDEPELSMHIDWQRQLVSSISALNPEAQIVMATHSPEIMADVPDECIFEI
jgi:predicted ATPase